MAVAARAATAGDAALIADYARAAVGPVPEALHFDPFHRRHVDATGIAVVGSDKPPAAALLVARDIVNHMLTKHPDLRAATVGRHMRVVVMA